MFDNFILQNTKTGNQVEFNFEEGETPTPSSDVSNSTVAFTEAQTRTNIATGEKLSVICGKIKKFFADLKTVAFSGSYNDLSDKPTIPTVNDATLTITQGGTTKGTFTANASENVTIDLDAGGGGGTEYTAGEGITITNNVISVTNPLKVLTGLLSNIPVLYDEGGGTLYNMDGTLATLASFADLGAVNYDFTKTIIMQMNVLLSGTYYTYDWGTQGHTQESFSDVRYTTSDPNIVQTNNALFDIAYAKYVSLQLSSTIFLNGTFIIGNKNAHAYFGFYSSGMPENSNYVEFSSADGTVNLIGV